MCNAKSEISEIYTTVQIVRQPCVIGTPISILKPTTNTQTHKMDLMDLENINLVPLTNIKQELLDAGGGNSGSIGGGGGVGIGGSVADIACIGNSDNVCLNAGTSSADTATTVCDSVEKQVIAIEWNAF